MKVRTIRFSIIAVVLIFILYFLFYPRNNLERICSEIIDKHYTTDSLNNKLLKILPILLKDTQLENNWQINKKINPNALNIYVLKSGLKDIVNINTEIKKLIGNCCYLGDKNIIVLDFDFLNNFLESHNLVFNREDDDIGRSRVQDAFLEWVIGHEIGHVILEHQQSHFDENSFYKDVASSIIIQRQEFAADSFMVSKIYDQQLFDEQIAFLLLDIINMEIANKTNKPLTFGVGILLDYDSPDAIEFSKKQSHPEYIIRAMRVLYIMGEKNNYGGLVYQLSKLSEYLKEKP